MEGNQSLLDALSHLSYCADINTPFLINICLGLPANAYVMWLILSAPGDKAAELFSLNQAVCETIMCVSSIIYLIIQNTPDVSVTAITYVVRFGWAFFLSGRPLFMCVVCLERYLAVLHPVTFLKYKPLRYRLAGTAVCWLMIVVSGMFIWIPDPYSKYVFFCLASTCLLSDFFLCVKILGALLRPGPGEESQRSNGLNSAKLKAFRIISLMCVNTAVAYVPYGLAIVTFAYVSDEVTNTLFCTATYTALVTGYVPPLLFIYRAGKLRHWVEKILDKCNV